jgi:hypothetical protein
VSKPTIYAATFTTIADVITGCKNLLKAAGTLKSNRNAEIKGQHLQGGQPPLQSTIANFSRQFHIELPQIH